MWCPDCRRSEAFLDSAGIDDEDVDLEATPEADERAPPGRTGLRNAMEKRLSVLPRYSSTTDVEPTYRARPVVPAGGGVSHSACTCARGCHSL